MVRETFLGYGCVHQILYSFLLATAEFLLYYHYLSVYGVWLTALGIRWYIYYHYNFMPMV